MQTGEVISRIQSLYSKGVESDDTRLSARHIFNKVLTVREQLAIDQFRKNISWSGWDGQTLDNIPMNRANVEGQGCPIMKSNDPLPAAITTGENEGVQITSYNGETVYTRTTFEQRKYIGGNKYTSKRVYYYIYDDYLYIVNSKAKQAFAHGVWRNPIVTYRLNQHYKGLSTCFSNRNVSMFTPGDILEMTIQISAQELIQQFVPMREDVRNNSADTPPEEGK